MRKVKIKICEKGEQCPHLLIERLVQEFGGLGNEDRLKEMMRNGWEKDFKEYEQKIHNFGQIAAEFEAEAVEFFEKRGYYPCVDPMQICWGRRKYQACLKDLDKKAYSKNIRSSPRCGSGI